MNRIRNAAPPLTKSTRVVAVLGLLFAGVPAWADLEVISLRHRTVDQVLPVLQPLVESGGALSGTGNQLVIRASRANIADLRRVVNSIDTVPRSLMISVRQDVAGGSDERGGTARVLDSRSANQTRLIQSVQALEGAPALIQIGQAVPVSDRTVTQGPGGAIVTDSVVYREVTTGFEVVPRIVGDRVILGISPRRDDSGSGRGMGLTGAVNVQRVASTASARLGEWFELAGASQDESRETLGMFAGTSALRQAVRRVWVKVEALEP